MGRPAATVDLDKALALASDLEDSGVLRELRLRKCPTPTREERWRVLQGWFGDVVPQAI